MATFEQRAKAIADAAVNGVSTTSQQLRLGRAYAYKDGLLEAFDAGTAAQKAEIFVKAFFRASVRLVRELEGAEAANAARATAEAEASNAFPQG